jgi:site-specific DNA-methyltransferase (adenine-specific)
VNPTDVIGDAVTLFHADCLDVLRHLPAGSVDAVVTDPPYSEVIHAGARTGRPDRSLVTFASITDGQFLDIARESVRLASRWVLMTCDWRHAAAAEREMPAAYIRCGVWVKPDAAPQFTGDRPAAGWEAVLILHRPGRKRWNGGGHHAVWTCPVERNNVHPTQKPLKLVREWLRLFTDPGDVVLDPFMGSGTTGVACLQTGRRFVGVELDKGHYETARRRLAHAAGEGTLFAPPKQLTFGGEG